MNKRFLTLGTIALSIAPIATIVSCSGSNKNRNQEDGNVTNDNVDTKLTKKKAKFSENQDYFEKTGYDPKRPLSDYNELKFTDYDYSVSTISDLVTSWGKNKNKKLELYKSKEEEFTNAISFMSYGNSWIPYVELYDFAHDKEIKQFGTYKENLDRITEENYQKSLKNPENIAYCKEHPEICARETFESWKINKERQAESLYRFFYKSEKTFN